MTPRPLALALVAALSSCTWTVPTNDAGERAFVIDTLRVLHGRAPRSMGEVDALVSLIQHNGRAPVVDMLIADAELVDHWARVLADDLGVDRESPDTMAAACYADPLLTPAQHVALAAHLRTATTAQAFCVPGGPADPVERVVDERSASAVHPDVSPAELEALGIEPPRDIPFTEVELAAEAKAEPPEIPEMDAAAIYADIGLKVDSDQVNPRGEIAWNGGQELMYHQISDGLLAQDAASRQALEAPRMEMEAAKRAALRDGTPEGADAEAERAALRDGYPEGASLQEDAARDTSDKAARKEAALRDAAEPTAEEVDARGFGDAPVGMICPQFNMTDAIRAGIVGRSLWVAWRAQLVPSQVFIDTSDPGGYEAAAAERFWSGHLGRDPSCLNCHTSTYSTTDARPRNQEWDRFHPALATGWSTVDVEGSGLTVVNGGEVYGGLGDTLWYIRHNFRRDALRDAASGQGRRPWGMATTCTNSPAWKGFKTSVPSDTNELAAIGNLPASTTRGPLDLMDQYPAFVDGFSFGSSAIVATTTPNPNPTVGGDIFNNTCLGCHDLSAPSGTAPALGPILLTISDTKLFNVIRYGSMSMGAQVSTNAEAWATVGYIRNNAGYAGSGRQRYADAEDGLAHLLAQRIVNKVVEDIQGYPLVLSHGFARDEQARALLDDLSRVFVGSGWSLQALLRYIALTNAFNRNAPAETWTVSGDPLVYELPMMAQPWAGEPPGGTYPVDRNANGQGDLVHKENFPALLHHVHEALGWPDAPTIGDGTWPSGWLHTMLGRPTGQEATTGRSSVDLELLARWEKEVARCKKPANVRAVDVQVNVGVTVPASGILASSTTWTDWIDTLRANSTTWTARDQVRALKSRLLSDPELTATEELFFSDLLGVADLDASGATVTDAGLRRACGLLLETPDYLLRRLPVQPTTLSPTNEVCLEPSCSRAEFCVEYNDRLQDMGHFRDCNGQWPPIVIDPDVAEL